MLFARIDSGILTVLIWCMRVQNPQIPRGRNPVLAGYKSLTGDCLYYPNVVTESASPN